MADIVFASLQYHAYRYKIRTYVMFQVVKYLFSDVNTDKFLMEHCDNLFLFLQENINCGYTF